MIKHRTDLSLRDLLPKMRAAGCFKLFMRIESGYRRLRDVITKRLDLDRVFSTVDDLVASGTSATCSFMSGFPGREPAELSATISLAAELRLRAVETVQLHRLRTSPPSPLAAEASLAGFDLELLTIEHPLCRVPDTDVEEIRGDGAFFARYFAPHSIAGTNAELAQVVLFFQRAIAKAPFTISALA